MIKSHRPRGHFWTCASTFQKSKAYRDISFEEAEKTGPAWDLRTKIYDADPDEELSLEARATKRRRVENLAFGFIDGLSLDIASTTSFSCKRTSSLEDVLKPCPNWQDVEDDWEYLRASNAGVSATGRTASHEQSNNTTDTLDSFKQTVPGAQDQDQAQAQASGRSQTKPTRPKISAGPSEEALHLAAQWRDRGLCKDGTRAPSLARGIVGAGLRDPFSSTSNFESSTQSQEPTAAWTSGKWFRTGTFLARQKLVDEDCSRDELGVSSFSSPSQRVGRHAHTVGPINAPRSRASVNTRYLTRANSEGLGRDFSALQSSVVNEIPKTQPTLSSHERVIHQAASSPHEIASGDDVEKDSQTQLLQRPGILAIPRESTTINSGRDEVIPTEPADDADVANAPSVNQSIRAAAGESVRPHAGKPERSRRLTSDSPVDAALKTKVSSRRKSVPSESQQAAIDFAETPIDQQRRMSTFRTKFDGVGGNESSPFMFRKKASKSGDKPDLDSETICATYGAPSESAPGSKDTASLGDIRDSSNFGRDQHLMTTPLVDQHLNRVLPRLDVSGERGSSTKKLLREEFVMLGAEITTIDQDLSSSQLTPAGTDPAEALSSNEQRSEPMPESGPRKHADNGESQAWPGTQFMLAQAQHDLFNSPQETSSSLRLEDSISHDTATPQNPPMRRTTRKSRRPHSQTQMPSTQALLDNWQGWSTIKKPRTASKRASLPKPSIPQSSNNASASVKASKEVAGRRSSLRFVDSLLHGQSPGPEQTSEAKAKRDAFEGAVARNDAVSSLETGVTGTGASFSAIDPTSLAPTSNRSSAGFLPSLQNAQGGDYQDCFELDQSITKLANEVLGTDNYSFL